MTISETVVHEPTRRPSGDEPATPTVLIVEDDLDIRDAVASALADHGIASVQASNGLEGLERLEEGSPVPFVILLDVMMPVMDGWAFRAKQLATPALASVPVIVFTAHANAESAAAQMQAAGYLQKPVRLKALLAAIRRFHPGSSAA